MITTLGKAYIQRVVAGLEPQIAGSIAFGVSSTAATLTDTRLGQEVIRKSIGSINADTVNNRIVFKASLAAIDIASIYEIGIYSTTTQMYKNQDLTALTGAIGNFSGGTVGTTNARAGGRTLTVTAATSATTTVDNLVTTDDLTRYGGGDTFIFGLYVSATVSSVTIRLGQSSTQHYTFTLTPTGGAGYKTFRVLKSAAVATGSPTWNITWTRLTTTSTSGGASTTNFDYIAVEDTTNMSTGGILVAHTVLGSPIVTDTALPTEVEYSLGINIT